MNDNHSLLNGLKEGTELARIKKVINQHNINLYAEASQDFNPVHIDEEFARKTPMGGTVAHGMLVLEYVSQMMTNSFGINWLTNGKLNVRFKDAARPGNIITISGKVSKIDNANKQTTIHCTITGTNENDNLVVTGDAILTISR